MQIKNAPGREDNSTEYRINVVLNKIRAASDRGDALAEDLKSYQHGVSSKMFDDIRRDPDFFSFLFRSRLLGPLRFIYYLAVDIRRLSVQVTSGSPAAIDAVSSEHERARPIAKPALRAPCLFVDVTGARSGTVGGGIKRVCDRLASTLRRTGKAQPCAIREGQLFKADETGISDEVISFQKGDTYLILDSFWDSLEDYVELSKRAHIAGATSILCIHDAFPISRPKLVTDSFSQLFMKSCETLIPHLDRVISVSQSSATEVEVALRNIGFDVDVGWFALGCDSFDVRNEWEEGATPAFLSIGTLEPKKGYDVALDAFEILWAEGIPASYTIVGKEGWLCDALVARITNHPDFGKRLIWVCCASDSALSEILAKSYCLIQASLAEGFGLPVAEAAATGLPVIASDLPVFKEICARNAVFFSVSDSAALADAIRAVIKQRPLPPDLAVQSWDSAAVTLLELVNETYPKHTSSPAS